MPQQLLIKIMIGTLSGLGGFIIGALSRQPGINKLRKQITKLQREVILLEELCAEQSKQIRELLFKYKILKIYQFTARHEAKNGIRGVLIYQYGVKDYLELLIKSANGEKEMDKADILFYNIFDKIIEGKKVSLREKDTVKKYISYKHKWGLWRMKECDLNQTIEEMSNFTEYNII